MRLIPRFSLRFLFLLMLICAIPLAWLAHKLHSFRRQQQIVATIEAFGGHTVVEHEGLIFSQAIIAVNLDQTKVRDSDLRALVLPTTKDLSLHATVIGDEGCEYLKSLHKLELLNLDSTDVTDAGVGLLKRSPALMKLSLRHTAVSDGVIDALVEMPKLRRVGLSGTAVSVDTVRRLKAANANVEITHFPPPSTSQQRLSAALEQHGAEVFYPTRDLFIASLDWEASYLIELENNWRGGEVGRNLLKRSVAAGMDRISVSNAPDDTLKQLHGLSRLETLLIMDIDVRGGDLNILENLTGLRSLALYGDRLSDAASIHITRLSNLRRLRLSGDKLTDEIMHHVVRLTNLRYLSVDSNRFTDECFAPLSNLPNLSLLDVSGKTFTARAWQHIAELEKLETLGLSCDRITGERMERLQSLPNLKQVGIISNALIGRFSQPPKRIKGRLGISDEALDRLRKLRPDLKVTIHE